MNCKAIHSAMTFGRLLFAASLCLAIFSAAAIAQEAAEKVPVKVKADRLDYDRAADVYTAEGNVHIEHDGIRLEADKVVFNNKTGEAVAEGQVHLQEKQNTLRAERLTVNLNTQAGIIYNGEIFMSKDNLHFKGRRIERKSETVYHVEAGRFTTCDDEEWYIDAEEIDVDMDRYATGKGVSFKMAGLPVLYTPYLLFPVRRQSGLLIPEIGYSSSEGFLMKNSVFWAISDYQDMTFISDYRRQMGVGTGVEYRYVNSRESSGYAYYNYFNTSTDWLKSRPGMPDGRWEFIFRHTEDLAEDLSVRVDINLVSDDAYYRDLEKKIERNSRPYMDSNAFYTERWDTQALTLMAQHSIDLTRSNEQTIQKLPELRYNIFQEGIAGPLRFSLDGSAANFSSQAQDGVRRADFNSSLTAAFSGPGVGFTPSIGGRATFYDQGFDRTSRTQTAEPVERAYYYISADINARLSRVYGADGDAGIGRLRHSIEPMVSYNFVPKVDQSRIPEMDSRDEVAGQNKLTLSLINRLTAHYKDGAAFRTYDMMVLRLSQSLDIGRVKAGEENARSAIKAELFIKTPKRFSLSASSEYDTYIDRIAVTSESFTYKGDTLRLDASHRYLREPRTEFLIGGVGVDLGKWNLAARWWRDMEHKTTTQEEYRIHYLAQCWGLGVSYVQKPGETQYLINLELKGIGAMKF